MSLKRICAGILALCLIICACPQTELKVEAAKNPGNAITFGLDVSKYQGNINWGQVKQSGASFCFVKIGSTKSGVDPYFAKNMNEASAAGLRVGGYVYSYATSAEGALAEANLAIQALATVPVSMPVAIDMEDAVQKSLSKAQQQTIVNTFCTAIESAGYYPMVYASKAWFENRLGATAYDQWVAQYNSECNYGGNVSIWQASSKANVAGISGNIDLDYLYKDYGPYIINTGWLNRKGSMYFYDNWHMKKGWINYNGAVWYTDPTGKMVTGWQDLEGNGKKRFFHPTGPMAIGLTALDDAVYFFGSDGIMLTGWQDIGGNRYLLGDNGHMTFGWLDTPAGRYYFGKDGAMRRGYAQGEDGYYFFSNEGIMQTGWQNVGGLKCFFATDGKVQTGWFNVGNDRFYALPVGACFVGWQFIDGLLYHFDETTCAMSHDTLLDFADGVRYYLGSDGTVQTGWQTINGKQYYFQENGAQVIGQAIFIGDEAWIFDAEGNGSKLDLEAIKAAQEAALAAQN